MKKIRRLFLSIFAPHIIRREDAAKAAKLAKVMDENANAFSALAQSMQQTGRAFANLGGTRSGKTEAMKKWQADQDKGTTQRGYNETRIRRDDADDPGPVLGDTLAGMALLGMFDDSAPSMPDSGPSDWGGSSDSGSSFDGFGGGDGGGGGASGDF